MSKTNPKKFNYLGDRFSKKTYKSEFIMSSLQIEDPKDINWPREMKIMNVLAKKNSNPAFWDHARPTFKIPSLAWYLTKKGKAYLNEKYREFNLKLESQNKQVVELSSEKIGDDIHVEKKILTLKDFIKK